MKFQSRRMKKKVVTLGGGSGSFVLLSGLRDYDYDISAIVSMADDGGSTGRLRDELGVLPPGDVRQCLVALSKEPMIWRDLFNYRFESGDLKGHAVGNLFLSGLEKMKGDFSEGLEIAMKALDVKGRVIPVTESDTTLNILLSDGSLIEGEGAISDSLDIEEVGLDKIFLKPSAKANKKALEAIAEADLVVIGPGNYYSSILPNLIVDGIGDALRTTKAKIVYIANLVNKKGHTSKFMLEDYVQAINSFLGENRLDYVIFNTQFPSQQLIEKYQERGEVVLEARNLVRDKNRSFKIVTADLLGEEQKFSNSDEISNSRALIRHDSKKLAKVVTYLLNLNDYKGIVRRVI